MSELPEGPWREISTDFYGPVQSGEYLLAFWDNYSRYPEVEIVRSTSATTVIPKMDATFARYQIPKVVRSDNGPPFNSDDMDKDMRSMGIHHRKFTP